jgi:hypothetical protein
MPTMIVKHRVVDFGAWKQVFDEGEVLRQEHGWTGHEVYRDAEDPDVIVSVNYVQDLNRAREYGGSEELRSAMERAGIVEAPEIWFLEESEVKQY